MMHWTDTIIRYLIIVLLVWMITAVAQYVWTEEMKRQDYCARGGIGDGGNLCLHQGGDDG
jgi:hypothetical protein